MNFDAFDLTFDTLRVAIQDPSNFHTENEYNNVISNFDQIFNAFVANEFQSSACTGLSQLQNLRDSCVNASNSKISSIKSQLLAVQEAVEEAATNCMSMANSNQRRIKLQKASAERRMKELVYEIFGEYGKCKSRIESRQLLVKLCARIGSVIQTWALMWQRYLLRLTFEVAQICHGMSSKSVGKCNGIECDFVCLRDKANLVTALKYRILQMKEFHTVNTAWKISTVSRITRAHWINNNVQNTVVAANDRCIVFHSLYQLSRLPNMLANWLNNKSIIATSSSGGESPGISINNKRSMSPRGLPQQTRNLISRSREVISKMMTYLKASTIEWTQPGSYPEQTYRNLHASQMKSKVMDQVSTSNKKADELTRERNAAIDSFVAEMKVQHTAKLANDRIYYSLEERASFCKCKLVVDDTLRTASVEGNAAMEVFDALQHIQEIYVPQASRSNPQLKDQPLLQRRLRGDHRHKESDVSPTIQYIVASYPDIVEVANADDGDAHHFAAATTVNLMETAAFCQLHLSSDHLRHVSNACPHPCLSQLANSLASTSKSSSRRDGAQFIQLFALVRIPNDSSKSQDKHDNAFEEHNNPHQRDIFLMIPLAEPVVQALIHSMLFADYPNQQYPLMEDIPLELRLASSSVQLLPDHPCYRLSNLLGTHSHQSSDQDKYGWTNARPSSTMNVSQQLNHRYVLVYDDGEMLVDPKQQSKQRVKSQTNNSSMNKEEDQPGNKAGCFYFVQLYQCEDDQSNQSNNDMSSSPSSTSMLPDLVEHELQLGKYLLEVEDAHTSCLLALHEILLMQSLMMPELFTVNKPIRLRPFGTHVLTVWMDLQGSNATTSILDSNQFASGDCGSGLETITNSNVSPCVADNSRQWDSSVLFSLCRWRSCLQEVKQPVTTTRYKKSTISGSKKVMSSETSYLCPFHEELKMFLDSNNQQHTAGLESSKYLPKAKGPSPSSLDRCSNSAERDMLIVRSASTLLQEMWDGNLKSTLQSYIRKVSKDFSLRHRLNTVLSTCSTANGIDASECSFVRLKRDSSWSDERGMPLRPTWIAWNQDGEFDGTMKQLQEYQVALESVLELEKLVSEEITRFAELRIFPSSELAAIRKDIKIFKDFEEESKKLELSSQETSNYNTALPRMLSEDIHGAKIKLMEMEKHLCQRKLNALQARRQEEDDARALLARKLAKLKALEEAQTKDPGSFRNQKSRL